MCGWCCVVWCGVVWCGVVWCGVVCVCVCVCVYLCQSFSIQINLGKIAGLRLRMKSHLSIFSVLNQVEPQL